MVLDKIKIITKKKYALFTANCSTALYLVLKSLNFKKKKIIIPCNICFDVVLSIIFSGNIPVLVDTDKKLGFNLFDLKKNLKKKDVCIIIFPYLYGNSNNFKDIFNLSKSNNIILIEDIAGSFGGKIKKKYFGSFADFTVGSFGQGKIIDMGGGGFLALNSKKIYNNVLNNYNLLDQFKSNYQKLYFQINNLQKKILDKKIKKKILSKNNLNKYFNAFIYKKKFTNNYFIKLRYLISKIDRINSKRNYKADFYDKVIDFKNFKPINHVKGSVYFRKNFLVNNLDTIKIIKYLNFKNIYARKYYPPLNYIFPFFKKNLTNYESLYKKLINFWVGDEINTRHIIEIKKILKKYLLC